MSMPQYSPVPSMELKITEMNKRLKQKPPYIDHYWWDHFAIEFFDDSASMLISFYTPNEGEKHFSKCVEAHLCTSLRGFQLFKGALNFLYLYIMRGYHMAFVQNCVFTLHKQ